MAFITEANLKRIIRKSDLENVEFKGEVYNRTKIYFFNKLEENTLLALQELLKDPENYFNEYYEPIKTVDSYTYIYEGGTPAYHKIASCERLNSDYENYIIPQEIRDKGADTVLAFRKWFVSVKELFEKDKEAFVARLKIRWHIDTNPQGIKGINSGSVTIDNYNINELELHIDTLLRNATLFYFKSEKHEQIIRRFSKLTYLAHRNEPFKNNDTDYSDEEIKELLKEYDNTIKQPLIPKLMEYYRLKFNPEIEMEGYLLERLGFYPCRHCHQRQELS